MAETITPPLAALAGDERGLLRPAPAPEHAGAMKAVLTDARFSDPDWIFERKLDGVRCVAVRDGGPVTLLSRNDLSFNGRFPEIAAALEAQPQQRFAVDGEVVAFDGRQTSFARLAQRGRTRVPVFFYIFDVLWLDGQDVRALPLRTRKRLLRSALHFDDPSLRFSTHRNGDGEALFREACDKGWEGLIAKRADSRYTDRRSRDWLKLKCEQGQELVIGGSTAPRGSRSEFGALLLGYYDDNNDLRYAGKVGTGFDEATLHALARRLRELRQDDCPFADPAAIRERTATWVRPELVAQVAFTEWTTAGRLRHPRFLGLREDKDPRAVVREAVSPRRG
ncbi:MAG: bifunctional non-ous end joining protein LigD [Baekduia sp.]|jgi:DNA ligase D-like protein (predicted ligase)|nr:bifunctional non-ous end joining protein LigD [Baekduia sp.]